jgi:hypothetical protein
MHELRSAVADLCGEVSGHVDGAVRAKVADVRQLIGEPLRVAVTGEPGAGTSTISAALRASLHDVTVIDSPGSVADAETCILVIGQPNGTPAPPLNPTNTIGVLSKIDLRTDTGLDPWPAAGLLAAEQAGALRRVVSDVIPVVGLLAVTVQAGRLTPADDAALHDLAALPQDERNVLLASDELFIGRTCPVPRAARERLLHLLGRYGTSIGVARPIAGDLQQLLLQASGFAGLLDTVDRTFQQHSDILKAAWAVSRLTEIATIHNQQHLRDAVERLVQQPDTYRLRLFESARCAAAGVVEFPDPMVDELIRLALFDDPRRILGLPDAGRDELVAAALHAKRPWHAVVADGAKPAQTRIAVVAYRAYTDLAARLHGRRT